MTPERLVRISLFVSAPLNLLGATAFAFPGGGVGAALRFPAQTHPFYAFFSGGMVALFGCAYFWLAVQPVLSRPLLCAGAAGKTMAAFVALGLGLAGALPWTTAALVAGDLLFAGLWFHYLLRTLLRTRP